MPKGSRPPGTPPSPGPATLRHVGTSRSRPLHAPGARRGERSTPPLRGTSWRDPRSRATGLQRLPLHVPPPYHRAGCCRAGGALRHRVDVPSRRCTGVHRVVRLVVRLVTRLVARLAVRRVVRPAARPTWPRRLAARTKPVPRSSYRSAVLRRRRAAAVLPWRPLSALPASRTAVLASRRLADWPRFRIAVSPYRGAALLLYVCVALLCVALLLWVAALLRCWVAAGLRCCVPALPYRRTAALDPSARRRRVRLPVRAVLLRTHRSVPTTSAAPTRARWLREHKCCTAMTTRRAPCLVRRFRPRWSRRPWRRMRQGREGRSGWHRRPG